MLKVFAVPGQVKLVSLRSHMAGDDSSSLARRAMTALQSRASASVEGGRRVTPSWAAARTAQAQATAIAEKYRIAITTQSTRRVEDIDRKVRGTKPLNGWGADV